MADKLKMNQFNLLLENIMFEKNMRGISDGYPENFIDRCFELFLKRIHILRVKKPLRLVLPYLGTISLQTMAKL